MSKIDTVLVLLKKEYPFPRIALDSSDPFELLVATILSAQCTDARVNSVTESLFKKYKKVRDYASAPLKVFEQDIRSTGFYRNKARYIIHAAQRIIKDSDGKVPMTMAQLLELPGVARKTANVVLYSAFGINEGIAVDTHVSRLSQRLGLTKQIHPVKIEFDLMAQLDSKEWGGFSLRLIAHGRKVCIARKPRCAECVLKTVCPSKKIFLS